LISTRSARSSGLLRCLNRGKPMVGDHRVGPATA
jgi:hypothetical protein